MIKFFNRIYIVLIFVALALLSGCGMDEPSGENVTGAPELAEDAENVAEEPVWVPTPDAGSDIDCESDNLGISKDECWLALSMKTKDVSLCEKIQPSDSYVDYRELCIMNISIEIKDPTICNRITDVFDRDNCLQGVAYAAKNTAICSRISDDIAKETCLESVALGLKDASICLQIPDGYVHKRCLERVTEESGS